MNLSLRKLVWALVTLLLAGLWLLLTLALAWPAIADRLDNALPLRAPTSGGVNYVIVAPNSLQASATAWADYRRERGYAVSLVLLPPQETTIDHIRATIQRLYVESGRPYPFYALLLGHAHTAYPEGYLPAAIVPLQLPAMYIQEIGYDFIASDDAYALTGNAGDLLPIAIGRVPATDDAEVLRVLARTRAYESHPPAGEGRLQVELLASDSGFGPVFDQTIETLIEYFVEEHLPSVYRWHLLYGHPGSPYAYPVADFPQEAARRMQQGAVLVTYIGHGSGASLGPALGADGEKGRVFNLGDVGLVTDAESSLVTMVACSAGKYDQDWSLAEGLLLQPGGPVATYAASRITLPAANTILGKDLFTGLLTGRATTAGEWIRQAELNYKNPGSDRALSLWLLGRLVPRLYALAIPTDRETPPLDAALIYGLQQHAHNLFGDPALALALPRSELAVRPRLNWQLWGSRLAFSGSGDLSAGQPVTVTLAAAQATILPRLNPDNDLRTQYENTNNKVVTRVMVAADQAGMFAGEAPLPQDLPGGRYWVQAVAVNGGMTVAGSHVIYLGWPSPGRLLFSPWLWWVLAGLLLVRRIRRRRADKAERPA